MKGRRASRVVREGLGVTVEDREKGVGGLGEVFWLWEEVR